MNLIDYFIIDEISITHSQLYSSSFDCSMLKFSQKIIQNLQQYQEIKKNPLNKLFMMLQRYQPLYICSKLYLKSIFNQLNFEISLMKDQIIKCSILYEKILLIRFLLNLNFKHIDIVYKTNPLNGQINFTRDFLMPEFTLINQNQLQQLILQSIFKLKQGIIKQLKNITFYLSSQYQINQQQEETVSDVFLKETKKYINHSNQYAWKILRGKTENSKKQIKKQKYHNMKEQFINSNLYQITNPTITYVSKVFNLPIQNIQSFNHLQYHQDDALKQNYLPKPCIRKQFKLLNEITVEKQCFEREIQNKQPKMQTKEYGLLNFSVTRQKSVAIMYSKQILDKLPPEEFMGLPKFYFIKNLQKQTENLLITNLYQSITYQKFLLDNSTVLSSITKVYMINQIILTIKYLRDHGIVFLNLRPQQIFIKKGFKLKLYGFRNSYHQEVLLPQYSPYKNIFPYVSIYKFGKNKSYDDERTDVYSLGVLIFESLFGKSHWNIKDTTKLCMNIYQLYQKYECQPLFAAEKLNDSSMLILKLLTNLTLRSIKNVIVTENYQQNQLKKKISLNERPYLDWMIIIIRHIMTYYQFIL